MHVQKFFNRKVRMRCCFRRPKIRVNGVHSGGDDQSIGPQITRQQGRKQVFVDHRWDALKVTVVVNHRNTATASANHHALEVHQLPNDIEFNHSKRNGTGDDTPRTVNRLGNVPVRRHDRFSIKGRSNGFGGPRKSLIVGINFNVSQHHGSPFGATTPMENALKVHRKFMPNHPLSRRNPTVQAFLTALVKSEKMAHLRPVSVRDDDTPIHLEQIHNVAHDLGHHLNCIRWLTPRSKKGVASQRIHRQLGHAGELAGKALTLCPLCEGTSGLSQRTGGRH